MLQYFDGCHSQGCQGYALHSAAVLNSTSFTHTPPPPTLISVGEFGVGREGRKHLFKEETYLRQRTISVYVICKWFLLTLLCYSSTGCHCCCVQFLCCDCYLPCNDCC